VPIEPDPPALPPEQTLDAAQTLLDAGRAFRAHEVLEATWKADHGPTRELWRALAQLAVGITHGQRANAAGAAALLRRAAANLAPFEAEPPYDVDVAALRRWATDRAAAVEGSGRADATTEVPAPALRRPTNARG
jgi:hypothetical protein